MPLLELSSVAAFYGKAEALKGISLHVDSGEIVALLGGNGAGKSTTLRTISGLHKPQAGSVRFDGRELLSLSPRAIVRLGIAHVPEGRRVFPGLTARENIMLGAANRGWVSRRDLADGVEEIFAIFPEIRDFADAFGWSLSGGQQQMVAVARGLMARPRLLLLDEPSLGLAPLIVQQVFRVIEQVRQRGTAVLLVEQNAHMALAVADRGYVMETGCLVVEGRVEELRNNDEVRAAYLGGGAPGPNADG